MSSASHSNGLRQSRSSPTTPVRKVSIKLPRTGSGSVHSRHGKKESPKDQDLNPKEVSSTDLAKKIFDIHKRHDSMEPEEIEEALRDLEQNKDEKAEKNLQDNVTRVKDSPAPTPRKLASRTNSVRSVMINPETVIHGDTDSDAEDVLVLKTGVIKRDTNEPAKVYSREHRAALHGVPLSPTDDGISPLQYSTSSSNKSLQSLNKEKR